MPSTVLQLTFIFTPGLMWNCPCGINDIRFRGNSVIVIHSEEAPQILGQRFGYASSSSEKNLHQGVRCKK